MQGRDIDADIDLFRGLQSLRREHERRLLACHLEGYSNSEIASKRRPQELRVSRLWPDGTGTVGGNSLRSRKLTTGLDAWALSSFRVMDTSSSKRCGNAGNWVHPPLDRAGKGAQGPSRCIGTVASMAIRLTGAYTCRFPSPKPQQKSEPNLGTTVAPECGTGA